MLINNHGFMGRLRLSDIAKSEPEPSGEAPVNTVEPSFAQPQAGEQATTSNGEWESDSPITYTYQWQLDGVDIVGEIAQSILYIPSMAGKVLTCLVKASNAFGFAIAVAMAATKDIARLDGVSQEWITSSHITTLETQNYSIRFKVKTTASGFFLLADKDGSTRLAVFNGRFYGLFNGDFDVSIINDGEEHVIEIVNSILSQSCDLLIDSDVVDTGATQGFSFNSLGGKFLQFTSVPTLNGAIYDLEHLVGDTAVNSIPLTNKGHGATQLATVGSINATMLNYTSDVWEGL